MYVCVYERVYGVKEWLTMTWSMETKQEWSVCGICILIRESGSSRRPLHLPSADDVNVQVIDALRAVLSVVDHLRL